MIIVQQQTECTYEQVKLFTNDHCQKTKWTKRYEVHNFYNVLS